MSRLVWALLLFALLPWALSQEPTPPLVTPSAALSASAFRAALDARADAIAVVRETVIQARRQQVALRDRVSAIEQEAAIVGAAAVGVAPLDDPADPWSESGIVAGQVARAAALNEVFGRFAQDLNNIRAFQALVLSDNEALAERIVALEALAGIDDAAGLPPFAPDEDVVVVVPHAFEAGAVMRAGEMNANLSAVDEGTAAESTMAISILARLAVMATRAEALAEVFEPQPTFTWRMGTVSGAGSASVSTEAHYIFRNPGPFAPIPIRWTGPNDFERTFTVTDSSRQNTGSIIFGTLPSGTYLAEATVGGIDFALEIEFDATRVLDVPVAELLNVSSEQVDVRVGRIDGAEYFFIMLRLEDDSWTTRLTPEVFEGESETYSFTDLELDPELSYYASVQAYTAPAPWDPLLVPQQVDRSSWSEGFSPPVAGD